MNIAPPSSAATSPLIISQRSCESALGLSRRQYLRMVRIYGISHRRAGKLVLTSAEAWRGWLAQNGTAGTAAKTGVEAVLQRAGLRPTG